MLPFMNFFILALQKVLFPSHEVLFLTFVFISKSQNVKWLNLFIKLYTNKYLNIVWLTCHEWINTLKYNVSSICHSMWKTTDEHVKNYIWPKGKRHSLWKYFDPHAYQAPTSFPSFWLLIGSCACSHSETCTSVLSDNTWMHH